MDLIGGVTFSFGQGRPQYGVFYFLYRSIKPKLVKK